MTVHHDEGAVTQRVVPGPSLYFVSTMPEGAPRAMVGFVPGYADHGARYAHVFDRWAASGIGSVAIDLRGHGRAMGARGLVSRFDEYLDDVAELTRMLRDRGRGAPQFLMGHSMGGLVASLSVIEAARAWRGLLLSAPYFGLGMDVPYVKRVAGRIASRVAPQLSLPSGLRGVDLSHDPERQREHDEDPLIFPNATARWFREASKAQVRALALAPQITTPIYEVFGTQDRVARLDAAKRFFERVGTRDKTFDERRGLFHEVLNEPEWTDIADKMQGWMLARA